MILIKTMKKSHLESTLKEGQFCFNTPSLFNNDGTLAPAQQDINDSHFPLEAQHFMFAPIVGKSEKGYKYGQITESNGKATVHLISKLSAQTPLCCFRIVEEREIIHKYGVSFFRLGDIVDRIKEEFNHDAYIVIFDAGTLLERLSNNYQICARNVHYGPVDDRFREYADKVGYSQAAMFIKNETFSWQQEFRVIIKPKELKESVFVKVGSIESFAHGGDIEELRNGFMFFYDEKQRDEINSLLQHKKLTLDEIFSTGEEKRDKPYN